MSQVHEENQAKSEDEQAKIRQLRDQLAGIGVHAEPRHDSTALMIPHGRGGAPLWVFVGYGGAFYSWQQGEKRHPVSDAAGAAQILADLVR